MATGEVGGESKCRWLLGEVDVNLRRDEVDEAGVGGPCFLIRLSS